MKKIVALILSLMLVISLCPMQAAVVSASGDENVALGKVPTCKENREGNVLTNLTDGNPLSIWSGPAGTDQNWVMIDLGVPHVISQVILHVRVDVNADYYREAANLELSNTPDFSEKVVYEAFPAIDPETGEPYEITITDKKAYRYVRVIKTNTVTLTFNEFEIYGSVPSDDLQIGDDVVGTKLAGPVTLLMHLGLMDLKYPDDTIFGIDSIMTRGEAAKAVIDAFAGNASITGGIPFADVDKNHPYYQEIMTACHLGYITGDDGSSFRPDDYATVTEMLFITLRGMGYADVVEKVMGNSAGRVIKLAEDLDLFKGISIDGYNTPITRGNTAVLFYNALLAQEFNLFAAEQGRLIFEEDADLLRRTHNLVLSQGIVEENRITDLAGDPKTSKNAARISGEAFIDPDGLLDAFLAKEVIVATDLNAPERIVLAWSVDREEEVVIPANKLISTEADIEAGRIVALDDEGDSEKYTLENLFKVVKNEVAYPYYTAEDLMLQNGQLRLLDNDRDGVYEVVFVEAYTLHYLDGAFYDDNELTFVDSNNLRKTILRENLVITTASGASTSPRKLVSGVVIKLFESADNKQNRIVVYDTPVNDVLTSIDNAEAAVGNISYALSLAYQNAVRAVEPQPGEPVSAYVDEANEILWIERDTDSINDGWKIAFSQQTALDGAMTPIVGFRLFTQDGTWEEVFAADKVILDGISTEKADLAKLIEEGTAGYLTQVLLRFKKNSDGKLSHIDTLQETDAEIAKGASFGIGTLVMEGMYTSGSAGFWNGHTMVTPAHSNTPTFVIPTVNDAFTTDSSYDGYYYVRNLSAMVTSHQQRGDHNLQAYMPDEDGYPACFMKTQNYTAAVGGDSTESLVAISTANAPFLLVEKVTTGVTQEGDVAFTMTGRSITNSGIGAETTILADKNMQIYESGLLYQEQPDCLDASNNLVNESAFAVLEDKDDYVSSVTDIGFGDIIRYEEGPGTARTVERYFDYDATELPKAGRNRAGDVWHISGNNISHYSGYYRFQIGDIINVSDAAFTVETLFGNQEVYPKTAFANVLVCEHNGAKPKLSTVSSLNQYEGASAKIMLYSYNGAPRAAVIYPYE